MIKAVQFLVVVVCMFAVVRLSHAQVSVLTYHNDNFRSGANTNETTLMPANVNSNTFGRLFARNVDGWVYAQPLVVAGLNLRGKQRSVVFVATEHDSVYAFDADTGRRYWRAKLLPRHGFTVSTNDVQCDDLIPEIGITSTPVIDPASSTLYVLAKGRTNSVFFQHLHALDLATGTEKFGGPVAINATAPGNGNGSVNGTLTFDPLRQHQRAALLLANGIVYIAWASHCDRGDYHGWVMGYNATTLQQVAAFVATPDGVEGGVWETGCGLAADTNGNLFCATGNGTFDADTGGHDFGDSVLKLSAPGLAVQDSFTPFNQADLAATDSDLGSGGVLLLPDQPGGHPHLAIAGGKEGKLYLLDRDNLGQFNSTNDQVVQSLSDSTGEIFFTPAYFNGSIYCCGVNNPVKAFALTGGLLSTNPSSQSAGSIDFPGATPSISANGTTNGIVWVLQNDGYQTNGLAILHAYDANDLTHELYTGAGRRQSPGPAVKFTVPTVANGHVYVGAVRRLAVYGLR